MRMMSRDLQTASQCATHDTAREEDYTLHRILHGVPEGVTDIVPTHSFPMDSNLDLMGARQYSYVAFTSVVSSSC